MANTTKKTPPKSRETAKAKGNEPGNNKVPAGSGSALENFFYDQVKDIYWAEKHLTKALPKMQQAATTRELKTAIKEHLRQTEEQVLRLEKVFQLLGKKPQGKKCDAMEGLVREGENGIEETKNGSMTRDVAIIMSSQKVEHYEIAAYGSLIQLAQTMGNGAIAKLLEATLAEENNAEQLLTELAENKINRGAATEKEAE